MLRLDRDADEDMDGRRDGWMSKKKFLREVEDGDTLFDERSLLSSAAAGKKRVD